MIKEYWNPIDWEPFLATTEEPGFSKASSFCRMSMNDKNFRFTPIPDKIKEVIFKKSPKTLFLVHFWWFCCHFCPSGIFSKNHNIIWAPNTMLSFGKN